MNASNLTRDRHLPPLLRWGFNIASFRLDVIVWIIDEAKRYNKATGG
jgi:hypothetical protein